MFPPIPNIPHIPPKNTSPQIEDIMFNLGHTFRRGLDIMESVVQHFPRNSEYILDIGTGRGKMAIFLALHGYTVHTGEPEESNWAIWKNFARIARVEQKITFYPLQAEVLPFLSNSYPVIVSLTPSHHVKDLQKSFQEMIRVAQQGGIIAIIDFTQSEIEEIRKKEPDHPDALDLHSLYAMRGENTELDAIVENNFMIAHLFRKL